MGSMSTSKASSKLRNFLIGPSIKGKLPAFFYLQLSAMYSSCGTKYY